ncbi:hypothetical protein K2X96_01780 [Patescibacteria group bacterium]|nr:hypothetical protein [Patescibacteria group bacterium]
MRTFFLVIVFVFSIGFIPSHAFAADLKVAGWVPYWRDSQGIKDAKKNIKDIDTIFPFAYTVQNDGDIKDLAGLDERDWKAFIKTARKENVEIIPSIMWSSQSSIYTVLSSDTLRESHIESIVDMVEEGDYDGVNIDYENKNSETKDYFSLFLKELKGELGSKILTCALEARTPPDSLYKEIPAVINYSNDYAAIAKYCDRVEIMAYDQQRADIKLNAEKAGQPYMPVSDVDWVRKVVALTVQSIPKEKIYLGIPTYGYHYAITVAPNWYRDYSRIGALNVPDILDLAKKYKVKPSRNKAGEMSFTYLPKGSDVRFSSSLKIPSDTTSGNKVAAQALAYANKTGETVVINYAAYGDAETMKQKIELAEEFDLAGVALFKIDGEEDKKFWSLVD